VRKYDTRDPARLGGSRPKRVSVERVVSGPGLANIYCFLRSHWAFEDHVAKELDAEYLAAPAHLSGAIVARGAREGDVLCNKAVEIFSECYGSEVCVCVYVCVVCCVPVPGLCMFVVLCVCVCNVWCVLFVCVVYVGCVVCVLCVWDALCVWCVRVCVVCVVYVVCVVCCVVCCVVFMVCVYVCVDLSSSLQVGVAALKWLPFGGLYVSGGIAAKNPEWITSEAFLHAYKDKGRLSPLVESVPVYLVLTEDIGERGALFAAVSMIMEDP